ncbi:MAG: carboxypeptidase-like regulatory domain-containing protein, partial [Candidatus Solibacter sp.]
MLVLCAAAQAPTAAIVGRVEDSSGAGVSGATVKVRSLETGAAREVTTGESGNYRLLSLAVGAQELTVEKTGFRTLKETGIRLVVGQQAVVNLKLEVGEFIQQTDVTANIPLVNLTTQPVSGLVGEREVKELPLNGRSFDYLITLNPGTVNFTLKSPQTSTSNGNTFSVAGRRPADNVVLLNGVEYAGASQLSVTPGGVSGDLLGIDAVREFNVLTDAYDAAYGK